MTGLEKRFALSKEKCCGTCKQTKGVEEFYKCESGLYGVASMCKLCKNKYNKERLKLRSEIEIVPSPGVTKKCSRCRKKRPIDDFPINKMRDDLHAGRCASCEKDAKKGVKDYIMKRKHEIGNCVSCGESDDRLLQFDHMRGIKRRRIGEITSAGTSKSYLDEEIEKTDLRCVMCVRYRHAASRPKYVVTEPRSERAVYGASLKKRNRDHLIEVKTKIGGCLLCGLKIRIDDLPHFECFDFDHIDPGQKKAGVSRLVCSHYSIKIIDEEIAKCRLLCAACHVKHTLVQQELLKGQKKIVEDESKQKLLGPENSCKDHNLE